MRFKVPKTPLINKLYRYYMNLRTTYKLIIIYILVILLPTVTLASTLYNYNYRSLLQTYIINEKNSILDAHNNLALQLNQISSLANYFQESETLESFLLGSYTNLSDTVDHYIVDVMPLIRATKINTHVKATRVYGFQTYLLNMTNGFASADYLGKDDQFITQLKRSRYGLWEIDYDENSIPSITYYKYLYTNSYPYDLGIVEISVDLPKLLKSFSQQIQHPVYICHSPNQPLIEFSDNKFVLTAFTLQEYLNNTSYYSIIENKELSIRMIIPITLMPAVTYNNYYLLITFSVLIFVFTLIYFLFSASFSMRLSSFSKHIRNSCADRLNIFKSIEYKDEVGYVICHYNELIKKINQLIHENYHIQLQSKDAEFYALQAQINPHFLYNILENIRMCAEEHEDFETSNLIQVLGNFMRYNLNPNVGIISLAEEMKVANNYLKIHKIRMGNYLIFDVGAFTDIDDVFCPRFIMQPLLENALKHGIKSDGFITISISVNDDEIYPGYVKISIDDNGIGIPIKQVEELKISLNTKTLDSERHVGLINVNTRIISYAGMADAGLQISSQRSEGTTITFLLPRNSKH